MINKYLFDREDDNYQVAVSKNFVITNWGYQGICLLDKDLTKIDKFFIEQDIVIDKIFCEFNGDNIGLYCPENESFFIVNSLTREIKKIDILKDLALDEGCLSPLYYWKNGIFIVRSHRNKYFNISVEHNTIEESTQNWIARECSSFYKFILELQELGTDVEVVTIFPEFDQFTYKNASIKEIGFIDCKNHIRIVAAYENDDIHATYFVQNKFIVIRCNTIESVVSSTKDIIFQADESCEFRASAYDISSGRIYVMSRFWKGNDIRMALYSLRFN